MTQGALSRWLYSLAFAVTAAARNLISVFFSVNKWAHIFSTPSSPIASRHCLMTPHADAWLHLDIREAISACAWKALILLGSSALRRRPPLIARTWPSIGRGIAIPMRAPRSGVRLPCRCDVIFAPQHVQLREPAQALSRSCGHPGDAFERARRAKRSHSKPATQASEAADVDIGIGPQGLVACSTHMS